MAVNRREFLSHAAGSAAVLSFGVSAPSFLLRAAESEAASKGDSILVVVQLSGGNDGLNTVVPFAEERYRTARPTLAVATSDVLKIDSSLGFHPAARGLADLLEANKLCIVQGVGYPEPNRSHFESMDIWHTCRRKTVTRSDGWLGRWLESNAAKSDSGVSALHLGADQQPLALASQKVRVTSIRSIDRFRLQDGGQKGFRDTVADLARSETAAPGSDLLGFVRSSTDSALDASRRIESVGSNYKTEIVWPESGLSTKLKTIAALIDSGLGTRVYYVTLDGFDTHAQQAGAHAALLREFSSAVEAFVRDVAAHGHGDRVVVAGFSEFGRRLAENASEGTDHGAAAPLFLAGNRVRPGLIGKHPSLNDLDDGDVRFHTDFRQVYAAILEQWLKTPSEPVLGGRFEPVSILKS